MSQDVGGSREDEALAAKDTLVVLDCFATWCGPCKVIAPQVVKYVHEPDPSGNANVRGSRFSNNYPTARFYKLDVDEVPDVAQELEGLGASVATVEADLATYDGVELLYRAIAADTRPVDPTVDEASDTALQKGRRIVDEQGDRLFG